MSQKIKIISSRGTGYYFINYSSKIGLFDKSPIIKKYSKIQSTTKLVCTSCKRIIDSEISRILITYNIDKCPQFFSFHFFSPCWNFEDFCKKHPNLILGKVGFSIPEKNSMSKNGIKDLQSNPSLWD